MPFHVVYSLATKDRTCRHINWNVSGARELSSFGRTPYADNENNAVDSPTRSHVHSVKVQRLNHWATAATWKTLRYCILPFILHPYVAACTVWLVIYGALESVTVLWRPRNYRDIIKRCFCLTSGIWRLSVWRLSRTSGLNREQRGLGRLKLA